MFNGLIFGTTWVSRCQKCKTNLDSTDSEWQWHQLGHMHVTPERQSCMLASHHSVFYRLDALSASQPTALKHQSTDGKHILILLFCTNLICLQCFDTVGWASGRACGLYKLSDVGVGVVICLQRGANCLHIVQLMPLHPETPSPLASFKSRLVLPFWYWLTQAVLEKWPLNGCSSSNSRYLY